MQKCVITKTNGPSLKNNPKLLMHKYWTKIWKKNGFENKKSNHIDKKTWIRVQKKDCHNYIIIKLLINKVNEWVTRKVNK